MDPFGGVWINTKSRYSRNLYFTTSLVLSDEFELGAGCGVRLVVGLLQRHLYSRLNFKLNRAAVLAEWRQLLGA